MKATIERATLLKGLGHVQSVVERRNTIPILSNVLLQASKGELRLTATDLDIEAVDSAEAKVARDGTVPWMCLPRFDGDPVFHALLGSPTGEIRAVVYHHVSFPAGDHHSLPPMNGQQRRVNPRHFRGGWSARAMLSPSRLMATRALQWPIPLRPI